MYIYIIHIVNEVFLFCYIKYLLDKVYYRLVEIIFYCGIIGTIIEFCFFSIIIIYQYINEIDGILYSINNYFNNTNASIIIFYQFLYFISNSAFYYTLIILLLYYLKPNHKIITDQMDVYSRILLYNNTPGKWYTIIPFCFQILALLFYFEILELNPCNLSRNTIKNIQEREAQERMMKERRASSQNIVDIEGKYYITNEELQNFNNGQDDGFTSDNSFSLNEQKD